MPVNRHVSVVSKNIAALGYSPEDRLLEVIFKDNLKQLYRYQNVEPTLYTYLLNAESVGSHFAATIRKNPKQYPFEIVALDRPWSQPQ